MRKTATLSAYAPIRVVSTALNEMSLTICAASMFAVHILYLHSAFSNLHSEFCILNYLTSVMKTALGGLMASALLAAQRDTPDAHVALARAVAGDTYQNRFNSVPVRLLGAVRLRQGLRQDRS